MQIRKIFLASSDELRADRVAFELMIGQLNQDWVPRDTFFHLVVWENFIDAMSKEGLQQEYNKAIQECDLFVMLFFTKVGRYTAEEFETAFGVFRTGNRPLIYTYFKDDLVLTGDIDESILSLLEFKKKLSGLNHYFTRYRSAEELKWLFSRQLDKLYGGTQGRSMVKRYPEFSYEADPLARPFVMRGGPGQIAGGILVVSADVGLRYLLQRKKKHRLERLVPLILTVCGTVGAIHNARELRRAERERWPDRQ